MSALNAPWTVLVHYNETEDLTKLIALAWVGTADIRSTMDVLQSCLLTLFACIYTALHLDVPTKTAWHHVLLSKLGWVSITLFAPEVSVYMAADQLHQAWKLRSDLRAICDRDGGPGRKSMNFNIDLRYSFFIVMGGVHVDVDDILSIPDLDKGVIDYKSKPRPFSVRLNPKAIIHLAERGHWIPISERKIDDKSKVDVLQKTLVVIQVSWMVMQCIARKAYDLPLSLLEIHTMVHVVCALILYICWFKKPLNVQDPEVLKAENLKGEFALLLQRQFYTKVSQRLALFPQKKSPEQPLPASMRWVEPIPGLKLVRGDVLPSGLGHLRDYGVSVTLTHQFLKRWEAILTTYPSENRVGLSLPSEPLSGLPSTPHPLDILDLKEFLQVKKIFYSDMPFGEGKRNIDINFHGRHSLFGSYGTVFDTIMLYTFLPPLLFLAVVLSASYGGIHLLAWNSAFPCHVEEVLWKISCVCIAVTFPTLLAFKRSLIAMLRFIWRLGFGDSPRAFLFTNACISGVVMVIYVAARVFIIVEAFISLRHVPVGVYTSPSWIQMIPHF